MQFFTKVPISVSKNPIDYQSQIVSIGSCFAENIGEKLGFYQFQQTTNPFGIIFNPISIEKIVRRAIQKEYFTANDLFFHNERWHSFEVHSELSNPDSDLFLKQLNETLDFFHEKISNATHFTITLGTSWVYKTTVNNEIVANCHKIPQNQFSKHLLSSSKIKQALQHTVDRIAKMNKNCSFMLTISPVRHLKDGFFENQISKANLIAAVYNLLYENKHISYFPSYEIMMDELRDYRFYGSDLLHPSSTAIDYIWSRFTETHFEKATILTMQQVENIQRSLQHRPFNPNAILRQNFLKDLHTKIDQLKEVYPFFKF